MHSKEAGVEGKKQEYVGSCNGQISYIAYQKNILNHFDSSSKVKIKRIE